MPVRSAGILLWRRDAGGGEGSGGTGGAADAEGPDAAEGVEVWIAHMGGPFWASKDEGAWSIVKGEYQLDEDPFVAALREFAEETGQPAPEIDYQPLGEFRQSSGKLVTVFAGESEVAPHPVVSNTFEVEWPPRSGSMRAFPEIDEGRWFPLAEARVKLVKGQRAVLDALEAFLADAGR